MAEIKIEKKKLVWPWILLGLGVIAILVYFLAFHNYDEKMNEVPKTSELKSANETELKSANETELKGANETELKGANETELTSPKARELVVILASEPEFDEKLVIVESELKSEKKELALAFEDVHFDLDKSSLTKEAQAILKRSIQLIKENPEAKIRIAGYTSASGSQEYNQDLSERRAKAVYDYLTKEGLVPPEKLSTVGYGEKMSAMHEPIPKNIYSTKAKANMRVLFEVMAYEKMNEVPKTSKRLNIRD